MVCKLVLDFTHLSALLVHLQLPNHVLYDSQPPRLRRRAILGLMTSMRLRSAGREYDTARVSGLDLVMTLPHCICTGAFTLRRKWQH